MKTRPDRRDVLRAAAAGTGLAALSHGALPRSGAPAPVLVLVQLSGGNDGLSTVVPHGDDAYEKHRTATRIGADEVLPIDEHVGLHPALGGLRGRLEAGELAIVQGCGYAEPNRSHFKSMEVWHAADARGRARGTGWVGRACEAAFGEEALATRMVHIGGTTPFSLYSPKHGTTSFVVPEGYRWLESEEAVDAYAERIGKRKAPNRLAFVRRVMEEARESSLAVRGAAARYRPNAEYPDDTFAHDLMAAAAVIHGDLGARVVSVSMRGFDTHAGQRARHDDLMGRLDAGLTAFLDDLGTTSAGREAVVMVFSEFGRRVAENGSKGTDHGTAGPVFVAGSRVRGGLYGTHPSLTDLDDGDLIHTTDFRAVYGALVEGCFGVPAGQVLGEDARPLALVRTS